VTSPPSQPVQAPTPAALVAKTESKLLARGTKPLGPMPSIHEDSSTGQPRIILSGPQLRIGEQVRTYIVWFKAGEERNKTGKVGRSQKVFPKNSKTFRNDISRAKIK